MILHVLIFCVSFGFGDSSQVCSIIGASSWLFLEVPFWIFNEVVPHGPRNADNYLISSSVFEVLPAHLSEAVSLVMGIVYTGKVCYLTLLQCVSGEVYQLKETDG